MKTAAIHSVDVLVLSSLSDKAQTLGISRSSLLDLMLRDSMANREDVIDALARDLKASKQKTVALSPSEVKVLVQVRDDWTKIENPGKVPWRNLLCLRERGLVEAQDFSSQVMNHRGTPCVSVWRRVATPPLKSSDPRAE